MAEFADRQISQLSGGQQQRVFLARALVQDAQVYFMDEPFQGVDARTERAIVDLLKELREQGRPWSWSTTTCRRCRVLRLDHSAERAPHRQRPGGRGLHRGEPAPGLRRPRGVPAAHGPSGDPERRPRRGPARPAGASGHERSPGILHRLHPAHRGAGLGAPGPGGRRPGRLRRAAPPEPAGRRRQPRRPARHRAGLHAHRQQDAAASWSSGPRWPAGRPRCW